MLGGTDMDWLVIGDCMVDGRGRAGAGREGEEGGG